MRQVDIGEFLKKKENSVLLDVRSPAEFKNGHVPGAVNLPLFTDRERKKIGIAYKYDGQRAAIKLGLRIVGPKMAEMVDFAESLGSHSLAVHCWRGGMRSASMAWLLETAGFEISVINGGYKAFRRAMIDYFTELLPIIVLGGKTGSGKTEILQALSHAGEQVVDLEGLAHHRGSAFGSFGMPSQPTTEQFQNNLFLDFLNYSSDRPIWIEDESSHIGKVGLPEGLWRQMSNAPMVMLEVALEKRVNRLVEDYGYFPVNDLAESIERIGKKLGGQHKKRAIEALREGNLAEVAGILLTYYDKSYDFLEEKRNQKVIATIHPESTDPQKIAQQIIKSEIYLHE